MSIYLFIHLFIYMFSSCLLIYLSNRTFFFFFFSFLLLSFHSDRLTNKKWPGNECHVVMENIDALFDVAYQDGDQGKKGNYLRVWKKFIQCYENLVGIDDQTGPKNLASQADTFQVLAEALGEIWNEHLEVGSGLTYLHIFICHAADWYL